MHTPQHRVVAHKTMRVALLLSLAATPSVALRLAAGAHCGVRRCAPAMMSFKGALLFDCDGVLVETEELHRVAYNMAFEEFGLQIAGAPVVWSKEYYSFLANTVGGGKPKMRCASRRAPGRRRSLHLPGASPSLSSCADHFTGLGAPEGARTHQDTAKVRDEWSL